MRATPGYLGPHWRACLLVLVILLPTTTFFTLQPLIFKGIVDDGILPGLVGQGAQHGAEVSQGAREWVT